MLNKIIRFSLQNRILILIVSCLTLIAGTIVTLNTEVDVFPDLNAPTVVVMTEAPGFDPEEVEKSVTFPIETAVNGATNVRRVRSSSSAGFSIVWVEFDWGMDIYRARQTVSEKLSTITDAFPQGVNTPTLGPQSSILGEMMIIGMTSDSVSMQDLRTIADKQLRPRLLAVGGVSQVAVIGGDVKEYQIKIDPAKMRFHNVTLDEVLAATQGMNSNVGGGSLFEHDNEYLIKGDLNTNNLEDISLGVVRCDDNGIVLIKDIAEVAIGNKLPKLGVASEKAHPAVLLTITKQPSTDTNRLTDQIDAELKEAQKSLPNGVHISTDIFRQSSFINSSISNIQNALIEGAIFVVIVLFFFLMNVRTTIISLVALPISIIITIISLHFLGYTINTMSLGGIAIAIGSLVDDAIVDVENVFKRLRQNRALPASQQLSVVDVVYNSSSEVRMPIFNSSLIIVASFMPLFFLSGVEGRLLIPLGISFIISLFASTLVALTLTPVLCSYLLNGNGDSETKEPWLISKLKRGYSRALNGVFRFKKLLLAAVAVIFVTALCAMFSLGRSFLPSFNEGSFTINIGTLPGVSLEVSDQIGREAEKIILSIPEVKTVARKTGRAELDEHSFGVNVSEIEAPYEIIDRPRSEILKELRSRLSDIPGVNIEIGQPISHRIDAMLSGTKSQIAVKLFGPELDKLFKMGNNIKQVMSQVPGIVDLNIEQQVERPELSIKPKRHLLARYGITLSSFAQYVETIMSGQQVSQVYEDGVSFDLTVRADYNLINSTEKIKNLMIDSNVGKIPLSYVADIQSTYGPNTINRENVNRRIIISANVDNSDLRGAVNAIQEAIDSNIKLPEGYYISYGGQFESEEEASRILSLASILALLIVFILLYHEFKDVKQSLIILINLPLAMIGGVFILLFTGSEINIPAIIGFISLLGITTRNGMLLITRYNKLKNEGVSLKERIFLGSSDRLSPILMTALTSALALIPLAINGSAPGNEIQSPMAVVILGGLLTSTVLNVFVVPILYYFVTKNRE